MAARQPISLTMGHFNCIWQRDACDLALRSLSRVSVPPLVLNLTGPDVISVREVCEQMGRLFDVPITFVDSESETALLSNSRRAMSQLGHPETPLDVMIEHTCAWVKAGGPTWGKPTHFQTRDGSF